MADGIDRIRDMVRNNTHATDAKIQEFNTKLTNMTGVMSALEAHLATLPGAAPAAPAPVAPAPVAPAAAAAAPETVRPRAAAPGAAPPPAAVPEAPFTGLVDLARRGIPPPPRPANTRRGTGAGSRGTSATRPPPARSSARPPPAARPSARPPSPPPSEEQPKESWARAAKNWTVSQLDRVRQRAGYKKLEDEEVVGAESGLYSEDRYGYEDVGSVQYTPESRGEKLTLSQIIARSRRLSE